MKKKRNLWGKIVCIILSVCLLLTGCGGSTGTELPPQNLVPDTTTAPFDNLQELPVKNTYAEYKTFSEFTDAMFRKEISGSTLNMHYTLAHPENYGISRGSAALFKNSITDFETIRQTYVDYLAKVCSFDYASLTKQEQLVYDMLVYDLKQELAASDNMLYTPLLGPTTGINAQLPFLLAEYRFYEEADITDYLTMLPTVSDYFAEILRLEKMKSEAGLFMSDTTADAIISQCNSFIQNPNDNLLLTSFSGRMEEIDWLDAEKKAAYTKQNKEAVLQSVLPAYQNLIDGLTQLKGTGKNQTTGLAALPAGKDYYQYLVNCATGCNLSVSELQKELEDMVTANLREIITISSKNPEILKDIDNLSLPITEPDACLTDLQEKIQADFPEGPETHYEVKYVSEALKEHMSPAFYLTPPIDAPEDNVIYINPGNSAQTNQTLYATLAHEGYPGHLYQITYFSQTNPALVRNLLNYPGYVEGWATYVECLSYEYSGADPTAARIFQLDTTYSLGLYSLVDIGVNYEGWTQKDTAAFLSAYGITDQDTIKKIFDTMVAEPSNYLSYSVGCMQFMKLRDAVAEQQGDAFSLKKFHKAILDIGPAPFSIIEKYLPDFL